VSAPVLESRRPSAGRLMGFALLLTAVSWGLGAFAAWPWVATDPGAAVIRVAFKHVAAFEQEAAARSKEELEKLPRHMRPQSPESSQTGRRVDTVLRVELDGRLVLERHYSPGGFRHDGPTFGYEEIPCCPTRGRSAPRARGGGAGRSLSRSRSPEARPCSSSSPRRAGSGSGSAGSQGSTGFSSPPEP